MDVNNVMNTYYMNSLWNDLNSTSSSSSVPLVNNLDSDIQENYTASNYLGNDTNNELQNIYKQTEPTYGVPLTYDSLGDLSIPTNTTPSSDGLSPAESNVISLLQSNNTTTDNMEENVLYQYNSLEDGIYQYACSNIFSSNPSSVYSAIDSLSGLSQSTSNNLDTLV